MSTAPTEPVESDALSRREQARASVAAFVREQVRARPLHFALDLAGLATVAWGVWWFADNDGGLDVGQLLPLAVVLALLAPAMLAEWRRVPRAAGLLLALLPLGALISLAFAVDRSLFPADAMLLGALPVAVLTASRLSRRRWTAVALLAIVVIAALSWSWLAALKWWGWTDLGSQPRWELVSWRNPSGVLSGAFGVWIAGFMLAGRRSPTLVAGALAGLGLAGAWLSSSRAAILFAGAGVVTVATVVLASRLDEGRGMRRHALSVAGRLAGMVAATIAIVLGLQLMLPTGTSAPIESRGDETVSGNAATRLKHWEAAVGMFVERPLTGGGIGSYRALAVRHNPADGRLTSAAHNEWLEVLGEGGLVLAIPAVGLAGLFAAGVLRSPRRLREVDDDAFGLQRGLVAGAIGAAATILAHASIDFDLRYPTIFLLAATGAGVLLGQWPTTAPADPDATRRRRPGPLAVVPTVVLLAVGAVGAREVAQADPPLDALSPSELAVVRPPWDVVGRVAATERLLAAEELDAAQLAAQGPARWSPGDPRAWMNLARVRYIRGELSAQELLALLEAPPTVLGEWSQTAVVLFEGGDYQQAEIAARRAIEFFPEYQVWGISGAVATGWSVVLRIAVLAEGCEVGPSVLADAEAQNFDPGGNSMDYLLATFAAICVPS